MNFSSQAHELIQVLKVLKVCTLNVFSVFSEKRLGAGLQEGEPKEEPPAQGEVQGWR